MDSTKNIKKPMILLWKDCHDNISKVINESQLPAFVLESIIKDALIQIQNAIKAEYNASISYYNQMQSSDDKSVDI